MVSAVVYYRDNISNYDTRIGVRHPKLWSCYVTGTDARRRDSGDEEHKVQTISTPDIVFSHRDDYLTT